MIFFHDLFSNTLFLSSIAGWAVAQILKTLINFCFTKQFQAERLVGSGGMPSSHSSTVCALAASAALSYGASSFEFAITAIFAIVVMYDAIGVRRETGEQAILINKMMDICDNVHGMKISEEKLKELVGHTPLQVLAGALLGVAVAYALH